MASSPLFQVLWVIAAVSASEEMDLRSLGGRLPIIRVPHALAVRAPSGSRQSCPATVCSVGRLTYQKAPDTVAELPRRLRELGLDLSWVWVGDGDAGMRSLLEEGGWQVTGWVDSGEVGRLVGSSAVLLHPARYEGLSLAIVEALSQGTPVVARRIAANEEFGGVRLFATTEEAAALVCDLLNSGLPNAKRVHLAVPNHRP